MAALTFFIVNMPLWAMTRNYCLATLIYFVYNDYRLDEVCSRYQAYAYTGAAFLSALCALHYYWFFMMVRMLYVAIVYGKYEDQINKVKSTDPDKTSMKGQKVQKRVKAEKIE